MNTNQTNTENTDKPIPMAKLTTYLGVTVTGNDAYFLERLDTPKSVKDIQLHLREWFLTFVEHYDFEHEFITRSSAIGHYRDIDDFLSVMLHHAFVRANEISADDSLSPESYESTKATLQALADSNTQLRKERDGALEMVEKYSLTIDQLRSKQKTGSQPKIDEGDLGKPTDTLKE